MKRIGDLFERVLDRENLRQAYWNAARGKRDRKEVASFAQNLEENLQAISTELETFRFPFGSYHQFKIRDPKPRLITAPTFRERIAHHAIMNICEPYFERQLIDDTFACRKGKGREACLRRAQSFSRKYASVVHLDIARYFDSISHEFLFQRLGRVFKDNRLLASFRLIMRTYEITSGVGIPIGTLCSQHFANLYLADFDRFIKESLKLHGYVRYMDDFAIWSDDRQRLCECLEAIGCWLKTSLKLGLKRESIPHGTQRGFEFLGHRVFPDRLTLNRRSRRRYRERLWELGAMLRAGEISSLEYQAIATSLTSFAANRLVRSWKARTEGINYARGWVATSAEDGLNLNLGEPGRQLEQHGQELPLGEPEQEHAGQPEQQPGLPPSSIG